MASLWNGDCWLYCTLTVKFKHNVVKWDSVQCVSFSLLDLHRRKCGSNVFICQLGSHKTCTSRADICLRHDGTNPCVHTAHILTMNNSSLHYLIPVLYFNTVLADTVDPTRSHPHLSVWVTAPPDRPHTSFSVYISRVSAKSHFQLS